MERDLSKQNVFDKNSCFTRKLKFKEIRQEIIDVTRSVAQNLAYLQINPFKQINNTT